MCSRLCLNCAAWKRITYIYVLRIYEQMTHTRSSEIMQYEAKVPLRC